MSGDHNEHKKFHFCYAVSGYIGDRDYMEDAVDVQIGEGNNAELSYFGVYDGHCGAQTSRFVRDNLCNILWEKELGKYTSKQEIEKIVCEAHEAVDSLFFEVEQKQRALVDNNVLYSGSTSVSLVINQKEGWGFVANAGDSRAILGHKGKTIPLSFDHRIPKGKAANRETKRVLALGAWIEEERLCGELEPTRGFGDHDFKSRLHEQFPEKKFEGNLVIPTPEFEWFSLTESPEQIMKNLSSDLIENEFVDYGADEDHYSFIVLATDGLWDELHNNEVYKIVAAALTNKSENLEIDSVQLAVDSLLHSARKHSKRKKYHMMDNTMIVVVAFAPCEDPENFKKEIVANYCTRCSWPSCSEETQTFLNKD